MLEEIVGKIKGKYARQYILLLFSQGLNFGTAFLNSILFTEMLTKEDYGFYRYGQSFLNLIAIIALLGIPYSASRVLINCNNKSLEQQIIGATIKIMLVISVLFSAISYVVVLCVKGMGGTVNAAIYYGIPAIVLIVMQQSNVAMLQGTGKARGISVQTFLPPMSILVSLLVVLKCFGGQLTFKSAWFIFCVAYLFAHMVTICLMKPSLMRWDKDIYQNIIQELKSSGKGVYLGSLAGVASGHCIDLILGYVSGMEEYAVYALSWSLAVALQTVPSVMGTVMFRRNAYEERLSKQIISITVGISIFAYICFVVAIYWMCPIIFDESYSGMWWMASILGISTIMYGLGDFFNRFIGSNGRGKYLQNGALLTGGANILFSFILVWKWKIQGVILARLIAGLVYFMAMVYYYWRTVKDKMKTASTLEH